MLYNNGFAQRALQTNGKLFFKFQIRFLNFWPKTENFSKEFRIVNIDQVQCVIYQLIRLNELYKLMESFFQISESFSELTTIF